jgi:hypothetical protein
METLKDISYTFVIGRVQEPVEFRNLWELRVKTPDEQMETVNIDADSLDMVLDRVRHILATDGF